MRDCHFSARLTRHCTGCSVPEDRWADSPTAPRVTSHEGHELEAGFCPTICTNLLSSRRPQVAPRTNQPRTDTPHCPGDAVPAMPPFCRSHPDGDGRRRAGCWLQAVALTGLSLRTCPNGTFTEEMVGEPGVPCPPWGGVQRVSVLQEGAQAVCAAEKRWNVSVPPAGEAGCSSSWDTSSPGALFPPFLCIVPLWRWP